MPLISKHNCSGIVHNYSLLLVIQVMPNECVWIATNCVVEHSEVISWPVYVEYIPILQWGGGY